MLPGQRAAGSEWADKAARALKGEGFERRECQPQFYYCRGDFHGEGPVANLDGAIKRLRDAFDTGATDVIRQGRHSHLMRDRLRLMNGDAMLRPSVKRIEDLIY
eukprot:6822406-Pyramimonas_sp.AAC.1